MSFANTAVDGEVWIQRFYGIDVGRQITGKAIAEYALFSDKRCLNAVFTATARSVGQQIKYTHLAEGYTNPTIKKAFELLCLAQVIRKVSSTSPAGLPLGASASARKFKSLILDIGLMQHLCGMPVDVEYAKTARCTPSSDR